MSTSAAAARKNMVDCQIQTNGVVNNEILAAFSTIPRELFLPREVQGVAYNDEDILLGQRGYILSPMTHARLLQLLDPRPDDIVLNIGDCTGYASAILSTQVMTVVALEGKNKIAETARKIWDDLKCNNIVLLAGENTAGCAQHAPYTAIVLNGAVSEVPAELLSQLAPGGRLVCVMRSPDKRDGVMTIIARDNQGGYSHRSQFDAAAPWVEGFVPRTGFRF